MGKLEDIAVSEGRYPLPLEKREKRALEMAKQRLSAAGVREIRLSKTSSVWVAFMCDGVGTKILIAEAMGVYDEIGIDAVAMTANDVICVGAKPVLLVNYIAQNRESSDTHREIIKGVKKGCRMADVELVGGETATLSDMIGGYGDGYHFDLATSCIGIVGNGGGLITGDNVEEGDVVIGLKSNGLHSNGFLWVRPLLLKKFNKNAPHFLHDKTPSGNTMGEELLKPTLIYVRPVLKMVEECDVKGISHITGGAFKVKLPRVIPDGISVVLDNIPQPPWIFQEIQRHAKCSFSRLYEALNMGIGMCIIIPKHDEDGAISIAKEYGYDAERIGYAKKDDRSRVYIPSKNVVFEKIH